MGDDSVQRCRRCKSWIKRIFKSFDRKLTGQQSVLRGYGRECWRIVHTQPLLIPEVEQKEPAKETDKKQNRFFSWIKRIFKSFDSDEAHIRVGSEWMTIKEYNRRYLKGKN